MDILNSWYQKARSHPQRILLADSGDERAIDAAAHLNSQGLAEALVVGSDFLSATGIGNSTTKEVMAQLQHAHQSAPNLKIDPADPLVIAAALVKGGWAGGCVAGASRPSAHVVRTALRVLGVQPAVKLLSSCFLLVLPDGRTIVFGDCAVVPEPNERQLATIAISCSETFVQLTDEEPRVAMLSFSTKGSAQHRRVERVRQATEIARDMAPGLKIDGELQFDAAWDCAVAELKVGDSNVAGRANVFVFPDLDSGNIGYKITQRLGGAQAFGPLLQGLNGVMHDLSRGCSTEDIVNVAVISSIQATSAKIPSSYSL